MKKLFSLFTLVIFSFVLTACTSNPAIQTVTVYKDKMVDIPESMLRKCPTTQPPEKKAYIESDPSKREQLMTNYSIELIKNIKDCNDQLTGIAELQAKQRKIIERTNNK